MSYKNYYKILGVNPDAAVVDIEAAYQNLTTRYSSSQFEDDDLSQTILNNLDEAYMVLADPKLRLEYDTKGKDWNLPDSFMERLENKSFDEEQSPKEESLTGSFKDFIEKGFKEVTRLTNQQQQHSYDIHSRLAFSISDAFQGTTKTLKIQGHELSVPIPKGAFNGQQVRLRGHGKSNTDGSIKGDLIITLVEKPHSYFFRNGNNLLFHASVDIYTALLGGSISVPTLEERIRIAIPRGLMNNTQIKVAGIGMPLFNKSDERGDLFVEIHLEIPKDLSEEEVDLIKQLRSLRR